MLIIRIFWFFLPAVIANMAPVLFRRINFLNISINKKYLGANKTYRGFFFGIITAILFALLQVYLYPFIKEYCIIDYTKINPIIFGFLMGFGALLGDSVESFFKRRVNIKPGEPWIPFDQIDWIIGANILIFMYIKIDYINILISILIFSFMHPIVNIISYLLGLQKNKI